LSTFELQRMNKPFKHLDTITGFFVAVLLISNIASTKILDFGLFTFDGGTLLFPLSYIFGDILTEVYGYSRSRKVIWLGFASAALMSATLALVSSLPPAQGWNHQQAYEAILGTTPRIVVASLAAYWCGEFLNSYVLAKMKLLSEGRWLWMRTIGSTLAGEALDTAVFGLVAFSGVLEPPLLVTLMISNYVFKCGVEIVFTPATYAVVKRLKQIEHVDWYDRDTDFNPFRTAQSAHTSGSTNS